MSDRKQDEATLALQEGQKRLVALGLASLACRQEVLLPIIHEERLRNVSAAIVQSLVRHYPTLLLGDPDPLFGALELAMTIGMLAGRRHAAAIPAELAALVAPDREAC